MDLRCPRCNRLVTVEKSRRSMHGPVRGEAVVDLWFRCGCGLRVDASGTGDVDAELDLARRLRDFDGTREIRVPDRRGPGRKR